MNENNNKTLFNEAASLIKILGYNYREIILKEDNLEDYIQNLRFDISEKKIVLTLKEKTLTQKISVHYSDLHESRLLEFNHTNNSFILSTRETPERYGMIYQVPVEENLSIILEILNGCDKHQAFLHKIVKEFSTAFDNVFESSLLFVPYKNNIFKRNSKTIIVDSSNRLLTYRNDRLKVKFLPDNLKNLNIMLVSIDEIKKIIENSNEYKDRRKKINDSMNFEIDLLQENSLLYLCFSNLNK